jgi:hypothetical protein
VVAGGLLLPLSPLRTSPLLHFDIIGARLIILIQSAKSVNPKTQADL